MLDELLIRGRRRVITGAVTADLGTAGCVLLVGFFLMLLLGTRILHWWTPVALGIAVFLFGLVRSVRRAPREVEVAHRLDRDLGLSDALATAVYFRGSGLESAAVQRTQAEQAASVIDLSIALPYRRPRSFPLLIGLAAAVCAMFFLRFEVRHTLALSAPVVRWDWEPFPQQTPADSKTANRNPGADRLPKDNALSAFGNSTPDDPHAEDFNGKSASAVTSSGRESKEGLNGPGADGKKSGSEGQPSDGSNANASNAKENGEQSPSSRDGEQQGAQAGSKTSASSASSGLMSKLKDAVSSLMSKMKPSGGQNPQNGTKQESQQANAKQPQAQQGGGKPGQEGDKGGPSQQDDGSSASDSDQSAPGQGKGKGSDQNAASKPGSGMGHQDGSKELKDAEQLAAMGKLSEIIGKRTASITGEMTIESQSGPQQLKTGYTQTTAKHGEAGGNVSRDEVPVALQGYVQNYFEQVRASGARAKSDNSSTKH